MSLRIADSAFLYDKTLDTGLFAAPVAGVDTASGFSEDIERIDEKVSALSFQLVSLNDATAMRPTDFNKLYESVRLNKGHCSTVLCELVAEKQKRKDETLAIRRELNAKANARMTETVKVTTTKGAIHYTGLDGQQFIDQLKQDQLKRLHEGMYYIANEYRHGAGKTFAEIEDGAAEYGFTFNHDTRRFEFDAGEGRVISIHPGSIYRAGEKLDMELMAKHKAEREALAFVPDSLRGTPLEGVVADLFKEFNSGLSGLLGKMTSSAPALNPTS